MWFSGTDERPLGETTDEQFSSRGAFEIEQQRSGER